MKILHTSDWHVGRTIRGRSRAQEHIEVLAELVSIADHEQVDLVLVVGDLFDTASPTPEAEQIVYRALLDLAATGATVVVLSGNHDNPRRLGALEPVLELGNIVTRAGFRGPDDGGVIQVASRDGVERAQVALLPFLSQRYVVRAEDLMAEGRAAAEHSQTYASGSATCWPRSPPASDRTRSTSSPPTSPSAPTPSWAAASGWPTPSSSTR